MAYTALVATGAAAFLQNWLFNDSVVISTLVISTLEQLSRHRYSKSRVLCVCYALCANSCCGHPVIPAASSGSAAPSADDAAPGESRPLVMRPQANTYEL